MTAKNVFRLLVVLWLLVGIAAVIATLYPGNISAEWTTMLEWRGDEGVSEQLYEIDYTKTVSLVVVLSLLGLVLAFMLVVLIGMFFFWRFARVSFVVLAAASIILVAFDGLVVMMPLEAALYDLSVLLEGAVIAMAYLDPVKSYFETKKAAKNV